MFHWFPNGRVIFFSFSVIDLLYSEKFEFRRKVKLRWTKQPKWLFTAENHFTTLHFLWNKTRECFPDGFREFLLGNEWKITEEVACPPKIYNLFSFLARWLFPHFWFRRWRGLCLVYDQVSIFASASLASVYLHFASYQKYYVFAITPLLMHLHKHNLSRGGFKSKSPFQ